MEVLKGFHQRRKSLSSKQFWFIDDQRSHKYKVRQTSSLQIILGPLIRAYIEQSYPCKGIQHRWHRRSCRRRQNHLAGRIIPPLSNSMRWSTSAILQTVTVVTSGFTYIVMESITDLYTSRTIEIGQKGSRFAAMHKQNTLPLHTFSVLLC